MVDPVTLESVSSAFAQWRQHRGSRKEPVPDVLRQQALQLLSRHSNNRVITALKINHSMLKQWQFLSEPMPSAFIALPTISKTDRRAASLQITLRNVHGVEMHIGGDITSDLVLRLAASVSGVGS